MVVIGIAGGSGSGKSTLCRQLQELMQIDSTVIMHDNYYRSLEHLPEWQRAEVNFDHPDALETKLLCEHLDAIRSDKPISMPTYSFESRTRHTDSVAVLPTPIVFVDGVLILCNPNLVRRFDLIVFVQATDEIRMARRIERDTTYRGRTRESVAEQWNATVLPMHRQFVEPYQHIAEIGIDNNDAFPDLRPIVKRVAAIQDTRAK